MFPLTPHVEHIRRQNDAYSSLSFPMMPGRHWITTEPARKQWMCLWRGFSGRTCYKPASHRLLLKDVSGTRSDVCRVASHRIKATLFHLQNATQSRRWFVAGSIEFETIQTNSLQDKSTFKTIDRCSYCDSSFIRHFSTGYRSQQNTDHIIFFYIPWGDHRHL